MKKSALCVLSLAALVLLPACGQQDMPSSNPLPSWNECQASTKLTEFVKKVTTSGKDFVPAEDRVAVFDMDGTLYGELFPTYLEYVMYEYRVLDDPTYKEKASDEEKTFANEIREGVHNNSYPSGTDLRHANLAAKAYSGMTLKEFKDYVRAFIAKPIPSFNNMTYGSAFYQPMREVVNYLNSNDFKVYVVSGSDRFLCQVLVPQALDIPTERIIGMDVRLEATGQGETDGLSYQLTPEDEIYRTDELLLKNLKFNKVTNIITEIGKQPILSFGNSGGDQSMHVYTINNNPYPSAGFQLVADDLERDYSYLTEEKIEGLNKQWTDLGLNVISMKNDFKTIYGGDVSKKLLK